MSVEFWIISISVAIVALAFVALVIFLGVTLLSLRRTISDLDHKIHSFDPLFRVVSKTGAVIEHKTDHHLHRHIEEECEDECREGVVDTALEIAEWTLVGLAIWQKIRERR